MYMYYKKHPQAVWAYTWSVHMYMYCSVIIARYSMCTCKYMCSVCMHLYIHEVWQVLLNSQQGELYK